MFTKNSRMKKVIKSISINNLDAFIFDFDGVLTDNLVHLDQDGKEWVSCNRSDGLGFDILKKLNKPSYIVSSEKNPVVSARAKKLKIPVLQGVEDKISAIRFLEKEYGYASERILYVGNDLNDLKAMKICGYTACPSDSHPKIKELSDIVLNKTGGSGVVRELLEDVLKINFIEILYME
jgi:3-deoxy-D-manno-octulosonate 8-phosphate phosphatase (KDO 8-P phosphatase)